MSLGLLSVAKLGPRPIRLEFYLCVTGDLSVLLPLLQLQTDLGSGEFSGDDSYITVTEVDKDSNVFQFHHEPLPTTATSTSARNFFPREKCLLPRQKLKRACDAMDTGAHDVARDDTQISHFLGLISEKTIWDPISSLGRVMPPRDFVLDPPPPPPPVVFLARKRRRTDRKDFYHVPQHHKPQHIYEIHFPPNFLFNLMIALLHFPHFSLSRKNWPGNKELTAAEFEPPTVRLHRIFDYAMMLLTTWAGWLNQ